jgi:glycosyltransferase involved in cell wall biosynthesis
MLLLDVTDLVEFLQRRESVSGVQRVIAETAPLMLGESASAAAAAVILDRPRGVFVALTAAETQALVLTGAASHNLAPDREAIAAAASAIEINAETVMVYLGAVWINDALMLAARDVAAKGAKNVYLLYDLTPVLETGHTAAVNRLFERYLTLVLQTASAVPSISQSSKNDFDGYAKNHGYETIRGEITALPCGLKPGKYDTSESPWPRDYALFVGTVESRKNHILALNAWKELITKHRAENVPDLVCIGRLGWNADAFLEEYVATQGLSGKVSVLSNSVTDEELARFYANAQFTVYPSRYEGWGLPVSESLAFGKVAIVANNSSLPEAGGKLATYFESGNVDDLITKIESDGLNAKNRESLQKKILTDFHDINWQQVTDAIIRDITYALSTESRKPMYPSIELGREYVLAIGGQAPDAGYADQYLDHLQREGLTPMLRQPRGADDFEVVDAAVIGTFGSPQVWGNEIRPGRRADFRLTRPTDGPLSILISTRSMPGVVQIDAVGPGGPVREEVYLGSVITLPLGDGKSGEPAQVTLTVTDATDSIEGFLGIRSFVVLRSDDLATQNIALKAAADALRAELDFIQGTRSWKVTAPLRKMKGRSAQ